MRLKERVRIIQDASMMEELCEYNEIYQKELDALIQSDIENSHVPEFPYFQISNKIAPSCKPLLVKQALLIKSHSPLPMGFQSSWHFESFHLCGDLLYLCPGYKFECEEIFCTLNLLPTQRILLKTHDILQIDIVQYPHGYYAILELETKSIAMMRKQISIRSIRIMERFAQDTMCEEIKKKDN